MRWILTLAVLFAAPKLTAQDFRPPEDEDKPPSSIRVGLFGFSSRVGVDFKGPTQPIVSLAVDVADLYTDRLRVRPSAEIGFGNGTDTYVANVEVMYRFAGDSERAIPYVGLGLGLYGQPGCGPAPDCPKIWPQVVLGFEIRYTARMSWLLEYHGEDAFRRHRFFIGLATRRGG